MHVSYICIWVPPVAEYTGYIMRNANTNHANTNIAMCIAQHNTHEITILILILIILLNKAAYTDIIQGVNSSYAT